LEAGNQTARVRFPYFGGVATNGFKASCGFSFGEGCGSSKTGFDLFAGNKPRAKKPEEVG